MTCTDTERFLREHPGGNLPDAAANHLRGCAQCRALLREIRELDTLLADLPVAELPPYFPARLRARMRAPRQQVVNIRQLWVPLAAAAAGVALVFFASARLAQDQTNLSRHDQPAAPAVPPAVPAPGRTPGGVAAAYTKIYPVWPADRDVVSRDDLAITASLYPAPDDANSVRVIVDDQDLTGDSEITRDFLAVVPKNLSPGEHVVTVSYEPAGGGRRSVSWSFYLLEDAS